MNDVLYRASGTALRQRLEKLAEAQAALTCLVNRRGLPAVLVAERLGLDPHDLLAWRFGQAVPTAEQLEALRELVVSAGRLT